MRQHQLSEEWADRLKLVTGKCGGVTITELKSLFIKHRINMLLFQAAYHNKCRNFYRKTKQYMGQVTADVLFS